MSIKRHLQQPAQKKYIMGHNIMEMERFDEDTRHMIIYDVLEWECPVGDKGERYRMFLSDEGYRRACESEGRKEMKIIRYARVKNGNLSYTDPWRIH
jgi:hypothetical protein